VPPSSSSSAPQDGTTSLYEYPRTHPDIFLPARKELRFFTVDDNWHRGVDW
jgi:hypothetical protein